MPVDMTKLDPFTGPPQQAPPTPVMQVAPVNQAQTPNGLPTPGAPAPQVTGEQDYGFDLPSSWSGLEDFWTNMMTGGGGGSGIGGGGHYGGAMDWLKNLMNEGNLIDVEAYGEQKLPYHQLQRERAQAEAMEKYGMGGIGDSTMAMAQLGRIGSDFESQFADTMAEHWYNAELQDRQQKLQAGLAIPGFANQRAGIGASAAASRRASQMQAADRLMDFGYAPLNLGQGMFNLGAGYQGAEQGAYNAMMDDPYMNMGMNMAINAPGSQYMPDQYNPGWSSQLMDMGGMLYGETQQQHQQIADIMTGGMGGAFAGSGGGFAGPGSMGGGQIGF